jgi:hypothetical protein
MKLRSAYSSKTLCAALVAAFILLFPSAGWAQNLTASANPPSGAAGVSNSNLTGSGFPAGAITGATVHFGASCATPEAASGPVTQVTTVGVLRRFGFLIPASLTPGAYKVWVSGTAGSTAFNTLNTPSCSTISATANVAGTASLGAAIAGGIVTLVDANGNVVTGTTASDGTFTVATTGLTPPFLVRVVTTTASGNFPAGTTLYSVSADGNVGTRINVHVLSDLMLRSFYSAQGIDPDTAFSSPLGGNAAPTPLAVQGLASLVIPAVQLWLNNAGVNATAGAPANGAVNLISSPFTAYPPGVTPTSGLDAVLHLITSETIDPGNVTAVTIVSGTITEIISPTYSGGTITLNTTTTNSANGGSSSNEVFTTIPITSANQSAANGINASLATFESIVNTNGSALTGSELLPAFAPDYLNDGSNNTAGANTTAMSLAGATITSLQVQSFNSLNTTTNVADVILAINIIQGGQIQSGTTEQIFKEEGGVWLLYGDQRIGQFQISANSESRTSEGTDSISTRQPGLYFQTDIGAFVNAPTSLGVTAVTVSGGGLIWNRAASAALFHEPQLIQNGQTFDSFARLSQALGPVPPFAAAPPPPGTTFTFNFTTASSGNPTYTATNNAFTTERSVIFINPAAGNGPLSSVVGQTITYTWPLPRTYAVGQVSLFAYIADGVFGAALHTCSFGSTSPLSPTSTSGQVSIPADMSACGAGLSGPIKQVSVFLEIDGVNGEEGIVDLTYPY